MIKALIGMGMIAAAVAIPGDEKVATAPEPVKLPVIEYKSWKCPDCNENEKYVLEQLQLHTRISDRNALATIMGNIKSESNFHPNICEGGARIPYQECTRGGYGLIQWTSAMKQDIFFLAVHAIFRIIRLMSFFSIVDLLFIRWLANLFL